MQQDPTRPVFVAPDDLLGKHSAVLGTTGSGKSCCVTLLLRGILDQHLNAHIVLLTRTTSTGPPSASGPRRSGPRRCSCPTGS